MAEPTVCVALRAESAAVRRGLGGVRLLRTGLGPRRTGAALAALGPDGPVAVLGVARGLAPGLAPGDVVVASEVRGGDGTVHACPGAPLLAGALRRAGHVVHIGPLVTVDRLVGPSGSARAAADGALAADMETAVVAAAAAGRPFAAVRVVSDTADRPVWHPGIVRSGSRALRVLSRVAPTVATWAAAAGDREVRLASPRSFCAGVERAIDIVDRALERFGPPVYVRRQIVHNAHVVADLERRGAVFVDEVDEVPDGARLVLAAHGVAPAVRAAADARHLSVVDATCPLVAKVHAEVRRYAAQGHTVLLVGHDAHEEVVGTVGEAPDRVVVVDGGGAAATVQVADPARVAYVMQTTLAVDEAEEVAATLRARFPQLRAPRHDDICYATSNRQAAVRDVAADSEVVLVVGSANSSNSQRLVEVARRAGAAAYLVDHVGDVDPGWLAGVRRVGITAGASAPPHLVDDLVAALSGLGRVRVIERPTVTEDVTFTLPREVS